MGCANGAPRCGCLCPGVAGAQLAAKDRGVVGHLLDWGDLDDLQQVEFRGRVFFTAHNQNVFEALVVFGAIQRLAVAHTVEFEAFQRLDHGAGVERTRALNSIGVKQRLHIAGVCRLAGGEAVFGAEGFNKGFGAFVLQRPVPVGLSKETVNKMKFGSVIVDMAAGSASDGSGNCPLTQNNKVIHLENVTIIGFNNLPSMLSTDASALYSRNIFEFIKLLINESGQLFINDKDELVTETLISKNNKKG